MTSSTRPKMPPSTSTSVLDSLAHRLRAYLSTRMGLPAGGVQVLAFEAFGIPVSPKTLQKADGSFDPDKVDEHYRRITNKVGQIALGEFHPHMSASAVAGVLTGCTVPDPNSAPDFPSVKDPFVRSYQDAIPWKFPAKAEPVDWYDPSAANNWTAHFVTAGTPPRAFDSFQSAESSAAAAPAADTGAAGNSGTDNISAAAVEAAASTGDSWSLRIASPEDQAGLALLDQPDKVLALTPTGPGATELLASSAPPVEASARGDGGREASARGDSGRGESAMASDAPSATDGGTDAVAAQAPVRPEATMAVAEATPAQIASQAVETRTVGEIAADPDLMVAVLAGVDGRSTTRQPTTTYLEMSFELCHVSIDRNWWSWFLLDTPGWTLPLYPSPGQLVPGLPSAQTPQPPPCGVPTTMLLVRNLQIAGWSSSDVGALSHAASLGPFSFAGGSAVSNGAISAPGIQVIGWVCQLVPPLPPAAAPQASPPASTAAAVAGG